MRREVVRAAGEGAPAAGLPRWALAGILTALAAGAGLALWPRPRPAVLPPVRETGGVMEARGPARREVHIVTPGGTQVVWVLDSEFRL